MQLEYLRIKFNNDPRPSARFKAQVGRYVDVLETPKGCAVMVRAGTAAAFANSGLNVKIPLGVSKSKMLELFNEHASGSFDLTPPAIKRLEVDEPFKPSELSAEAKAVKFGQNAQGRAFDF